MEFNNGMVCQGRDSMVASIKIEPVVFYTDANREHVLRYLHHVFPNSEVWLVPSFREVGSFMISTTKLTI